MKIRNDFVTNSSSSSYIIAYRSLPTFDNETIDKYPFLKNYGKMIEKVLFAEGDNDTTAGEVFRTKEEYDKWFVERYSWKNETVEDLIKDDRWLREEYNKVIKYIEKGFNILAKDVDYHDEYCVCVLNELATDEENFVILEND